MIYLDYAATTPLAREVREAMEPYLGDRFGNPSSVHRLGQEAVSALDRSRETIARAMGAEFHGVIFTGSATEANNLALRGAVGKYAERVARETGAARRAQLPKIIISGIEHDSVFETARDLECRGEVELAILPVNREGVVSVKDLASLLDDRTVLASILYGSNEVGSVQPIREIADLLRSRRLPKSRYPLLHTDAVQAFAYLSSSLPDLGADLVTISGHKLCGPKGVGALIVRSDGEKPGCLLTPIVTGGSQEYGVRAGTESVAAIVGFAAAVGRARERRDRARETVALLSEFARREAARLDPAIEVNGPREPSHALPHIISLRFPGRLAEPAVLKLDSAGIAVSAGSACSARAMKPSRVLLAMGRSEREARESIRISFGEETTEEEIARALRIASES